MIEVSEVDGITVVTLASGKVNAMDTELLEGISSTFDDLAASDCRAAVLTGAGRAFCAGVELKVFAEGGPAYTEKFLPALDGAFESVFNFPKPVVAAVNGHAIAGGCILAGACDRKIMANSGGRMGVTELYVGLPFPVVALEVFRYAVGDRRADDLILTGRTCPADEALAVGLVDEVVAPDDLMTRALTVARELSEYIPAHTFRINKAQLRRETNNRIARYRAVDNPETLEVWSQPEAGEWAKAFVERVSGKG
jgi:enoyl-CoA hydratase